MAAASRISSDTINGTATARLIAASRIPRRQFMLARLLLPQAKAALSCGKGI
jgi:hypothetical protein